MARLEKYRGSGFILTHSVDDFPEDQSFPLHVHEDYELLCVAEGKVGYVVEGQVYDLRSGSLVLMRSAETHKLLVNRSERYERYTLNFRPELLAEHGFPAELLSAFTERGLGERNQYHPSEFFGIEPLGVFRQMCADCAAFGAEVAVPAHLVSLLCAINGAFLQKKESPTAAEDDMGRRIIDYINEHLTEELSLSVISDQIHMSTSQINRVFRKLTGTSVYHYIVSKRLVVAQGMIAKGESATAAGQACGFRDYSSFYRLYKKRFGTAPTTGKKKIMQIKA